MKFYKSILFLLVLDLLFVLPVWFFLDVRFLIPTFVFLLIFNLSLFFFPDFYLRKKFLFSVFTPDDPYGVSVLFEDLKKQNDFKDIQLLKIAGLDCAFFYFNLGKKVFVALSEDILQNFPKENIKYFLSYPFYLSRSGDLLFLTLLSGFLFFTEKLIYFLSYPIFFIRKKSVKKENLFLVFILSCCSLITKRIFYKADKNLFLKEEDKKKQALFLWKLNAFMRLKSTKNFPFLAPLFLTNPLTDSDWECYISLQPLIEDRLKSLTGVYPP